MFERFTDQARRVVVLAQEETRLLKDGYIGTEHILLGLIREDLGTAAEALNALGIDLQAARHRVREIRGASDEQQPGGHIPFTPRAKLVLELSLREALQLGHDYIGTEHILLGIVREGHGVAAQVLVDLGADLNRVRHRVMGLLHHTESLGASASLQVTAERRDPAGLSVQRRVMPGRRERLLTSGFRVRLNELESRLTAVEQRLEAEIARLRQTLRQHGIEPQAGDQPDHQPAAGEAESDLETGQA
jgi:ATP-dependent Clp protease ATP-binding subunit ClpA